ncbi:hypothetical protein B0H12DRAFT_1241005 [Mycena haematopus]|nr:hypothetical protein B0H12DRAFT_1241005 [Mycena haematopus]
MTSQILSRLLATNDAPSEQEALEVRSIADTARKELRTNEAQLSLLEGRGGPNTSMKTLRRQNASLRQTTQFCRCILSPLRRIPPEILALIFLFSTPPMSEARNVPWYESLYCSPWTLGRVSRRWRAVALTSPALWSSIIHERPRIGDLLPADARSPAHSVGHVPARHVFDCEPFNDKSCSDVAENVLNALGRHSLRWKSLYITASQCASLSSVRGRLPLLEKLSVWGRDDEGTQDGNSPPPPADHFFFAPRLRSLEVDAGFPFFAVPWAQLTRYEALGPWGGHITALARLKNAELCSFTIADEVDLEDPYTWGERTVELPKLRRLEVTTERFFHGIEEYWVWPRWLRVPGLTELAIPDGLLYDLPRLQQASRFSLTKLHIIMGCPEAEALRPVLLSNPDISELLLCLGGAGSQSRDFTHSKVPALLDLLTLAPHQPDLLPNLETLVVKSHTTDEYSDGIGKMIASRWRTTRLRSVHAVDIGPGLVSRLNDLENEGLGVFIRRTKSRMRSHSYGDYESPFELER